MAGESVYKRFRYRFRFDRVYESFFILTMLHPDTQTVGVGVVGPSGLVDTQANSAQAPGVDWVEMD